MNVETKTLVGTINAMLGAEEIIFMRPPRGYRITIDGRFVRSYSPVFDPHWVLKLLRAIYGLKQSGRCWEARLRAFLKKIGAQQCSHDPCLWSFKNGTLHLFFVVYVDDLVIASNSDEHREEFLKILKGTFKLRDNGPLTWVFGAGIVQDLTAGTVTLNQTIYLEELIQAVGRPTRARKTRITPCTEEITRLPKLEEESLIHPNYRSIIGKLMWAWIISRPDIGFSVAYLSRFSSGGGEEHYEAACRIVDYLHATKEKHIVYRRAPTGVLEALLTKHTEFNQLPFTQDQIKMWSDASHGGERPMVGDIGFIADGPFTWSSYRLKTTPLSVCEGEYFSATHAATAAVANAYVANFLGLTQTGPIPIFCDNIAAVLLSDAGKSSKRMLHVATRMAFLRELVEAKEIILLHTRAPGQIADIFTKPLAANDFHALRSFLL